MVEGPVTYDFTRHSRIRGHTYMMLEVCWDGLLDTFFWALTIPTVTALGSCVKWP